ncbi:uncharacterized protein EV422DRAFT_524588 [Fimicolochytrium jonesii]|uniref:uncharacterized protein n=1 Tax=Fimicolochytrium jonesii TaxID=1396493 RepID=UPI0022FE36C4|nr:uncharacterized protein EV422DRAFT_524588 [Fimicolochytrium jonesii]KAI8822587.1 hypothetical protein EV422DRAFT_524588 [Fimicolochytrium jonesii]
MSYPRQQVPASTFQPGNDATGTSFAQLPLDDLFPAEFDPLLLYPPYQESAIPYGGYQPSFGGVHDPTNGVIHQPPTPERSPAFMYSRMPDIALAPTMMSYPPTHAQPYLVWLPPPAHYQHVPYPRAGPGWAAAGGWRMVPRFPQHQLAFLRPDYGGRPHGVGPQSGDGAVAGISLLHRGMNGFDGGIREMSPVGYDAFQGQALRAQAGAMVPVGYMGMHPAYPASFHQRVPGDASLNLDIDHLVQPSNSGQEDPQQLLDYLSRPQHNKADLPSPESENQAALANPMSPEMDNEMLEILSAVLGASPTKSPETEDTFFGADLLIGQAESSVAEPEISSFAAELSMGQVERSVAETETPFAATESFIREAETSASQSGGAAPNEDQTDGSEEEQGDTSTGVSDTDDTVDEMLIYAGVSDLHENLNNLDDLFADPSGAEEDIDHASIGVSEAPENSSSKPISNWHQKEYGNAELQVLKKMKGKTKAALAQIIRQDPDPEDHSVWKKKLPTSIGEVQMVYVETGDRCIDTLSRVMRHGEKHAVDILSAALNSLKFDLDKMGMEERRVGFERWDAIYGGQYWRLVETYEGDDEDGGGDSSRKKPRLQNQPPSTTQSAHPSPHNNSHRAQTRHPVSHALSSQHQRPKATRAQPKTYFDFEGYLAKMANDLLFKAPFTQA